MIEVSKSSRMNPDFGVGGRKKGYSQNWQKEGSHPNKAAETNIVLCVVSRLSFVLDAGTATLPQGVSAFRGEWRIVFKSSFPECGFNVVFTVNHL